MFRIWETVGSCCNKIEIFFNTPSKEKSKNASILFLFVVKFSKLWQPAWDHKMALRKTSSTLHEGTNRVNVEPPPSTVDYKGYIDRHSLVWNRRWSGKEPFSSSCIWYLHKTWNMKENKLRKSSLKIILLHIVLPAVLRVLQDRDKGLSSKPDLGSLFRFDADRKSAQEFQNCQCFFGFSNDFLAILHLDRLQNLLWFVIGIVQVCNHGRWTNAHFSSV